MFTLSNNLKNKAVWITVVFYVMVILLIVAATCYGILAFKVYFYHQKISEIRTSISAYGTPEEKAYEKLVFDNKQQVDDFTTIINDHKISSNVFNFIESNTLPSVWFFSFNMSETNNELRLAGEAENMEMLSRQFKIFETSTDYIKNISVLNSQVAPSGRPNFTLSITLNPNIFDYK